MVTFPLQFVSSPRTVSSGGGGDVTVLCKERRILEVVSNVLRLYVGIESERAQAVQCTLLELAVHLPRARVSAGSLCVAGRAERRAATSDGAG